MSSPWSTSRSSAQDSSLCGLPILRTHQFGLETAVRRRNWEKFELFILSSLLDIVLKPKQIAAVGRAWQVRILRLRLARAARPASQQSFKANFAAFPSLFGQNALPLRPHDAVPCSGSRSRACSIA